MNDLQLIYFTLNSPTKATARLNGEIGWDIIPSVFVQELTYLENMGVVEVDIRINSCGGSVIDGMTMFDAIRISKAAITCYNVGVCASTAGWLFLSGKQAIMMDYARLMMHNPYGSDGSAKGNEIVEGFRQSIVTMLAERSGQTPENIAEMMNAETWLNAEQCLALGFATCIEKTGLIIELDPAKQTANQMLLVVNSANKKLMENTENKDEVKAPEVTNEVAPVTNNAAETNVVEPATNVENEALKLQNEELTRKHNEAMQRLAEMEVILNAFNQEKANEEAEAKRVQVTNLIEDAIKAGKITEDSRAKFQDLANKDFGVTELALNAIPASAIRTSVNVLDLAQNSSQVTEIPNLREMQKNEPHKLNRILMENKALYAQMYKKQYGVEWNGGPHGSK